MPLTNTIRYAFGGLQPKYPGEAKTRRVGLKPSSEYAAGTVMAELNPANDVQTITMSASGGTFTLTITMPNGVEATTAAVDYNVSTTNLATAINNAISALIVSSGTDETGDEEAGNAYSVSGSAGSSYVLTATGNLATTFMPLMTVNTGSLTGGSATVAHTTNGVCPNTMDAYTSSAGSGESGDGLGVPKGLLRYPCVTDSSGNITEGEQAGGDDLGQTDTATTLYYEGTFDTDDLTGLDEVCIGLGGLGGIPPLGRLIQGSLDLGGVFHMP